MIEELLLPFQFSFLINAFIITMIIAVPTSLLSCFLVLKGWSLMGDAVSHAVLPGIVLAYIAGIPLVIGAFAAGMTCSLLTGFLKENSRVKQDTVMGVVFSGMFGFGLVLYTKIQSDVHLDHILFGNMLGVNWNDIYLTAGIGILVTAAIVFKWKDLLLFSFDPAQAKASGLNTGLLHYGLLAVLSLTIVATLKAVGIILAIGLLIAPGAIAFLVTKRFEHMMMISVAVTVFSSFTGIYLSVFLDSAPAPTIILILTAIFVICFTRLIWLRHKTETSGTSSIGG
ncbi:metal ABC transporter permease [Cochlodiniinecator piscidefendens]|uniref:metal ABC transporter permease n=1 Tax=Cochlodiniinecator piscidefendens TaxID=2715756 RepID=UPI00140CEF8E|nr:metal ABC transporter permease [Cochlodiniinecator piscidefendens]